MAQERKVRGATKISQGEKFKYRSCEKVVRENTSANFTMVVRLRGMSIVNLVRAVEMAFLRRACDTRMDLVRNEVALNLCGVKKSLDERGEFVLRRYGHVVRSVCSDCKEFGSLTGQSKVLYISW